MFFLKFTQICHRVLVQNILDKHQCLVYNPLSGIQDIRFDKGLDMWYKVWG